MSDLDRELFYWINHGWSAPVLDAFFPWITNLKNWIPALGVLVLWMLVRGGHKARLCVLCLALALTLSDRILVEFLKPGFDRDRPCDLFEDVRLLVRGPTSPSFPSAHAANIFAAMMVFGLFFRRSLWIGLPIATAVGLSRVYVGVHFPFDVLAGALYGCAVGAVSVGGLRALGTRFPALAWESTPPPGRVEPRGLEPPA